MNKAEIFEFFRILAEDNPAPETELEFGNTYQLLVAVVLSAQATDVGVNKATRALFREEQFLPSPVIDRLSFRAWEEAGASDSFTRARARVAALGS